MAKGGSYIIEKPGADPRLVERTINHPDGNGPRPAPEPVPAPLDAPATKVPKTTAA